jgi:hypothetical protein
MSGGCKKDLPPKCAPKRVAETQKAALQHHR